MRRGFCRATSQSTCLGRLRLDRLFTTTASQGSVKVFDRELKLKQKTWAATLSNSEEYDYVRREIAGRLVMRLLDFDTDKKCPNALEVGANSGQLYKELMNQFRDMPDVGMPAGIEQLTSVDFCKQMLFRDEIPFKNERTLRTRRVAADEESSRLPFEDNSFDIAISSMSLQWVNDIPQTMTEILRVLKADGVFMGAFLGGSTLQELRSALVVSEMERRGGIGTHMSPLVNPPDVGNLLSRCGFDLVTVDNESISVPYPSLFHLAEHLRGAGDTHAPAVRETGNVSRDVMLAAAGVYDAMYALGTGTEMEAVAEDYSEESELHTDESKVVVPATFQVIYFIAWKPHESQPKPLERGSASHSFGQMEELVKDATKEDSTDSK